MTAVLDETNIHLTNFSELAKGQAGKSFVVPLRESAIQRFKEVGFPTTDQEEWRHTSVAPIAKSTFKLGSPDSVVSSARLAQFSFGGEACAEIVLINGHFSAKLSSVKNLPRGLKILSLADAIAREPKLIEPHLARYADIKANPFVALNTGFINDGVVIHVARGVQIEKPIHLMQVSITGDEMSVSHPRTLILIDDGAAATVVESYFAGNDVAYFTNSVVEIVAGNDARLEHYRLQQESLHAYHVSTVQVQLGRATQFISQSAAMGSLLTRNDLNIVLGGERAEATMNGLIFIGGDQHVDNHTLLDHAMPNCPSHELYKYVLGGKSTGVFKGKILVRRDAQKTDSKQTSKGLLLSDDATMHAQPALEIYADDVKCTHGSSTGPIDEDMMFYLRTRGISREAARHLLTYAFAADITRRIKVEPVRRRLENYMAAQAGLPQDLRITELGSATEKHRT